MGHQAERAKKATAAMVGRRFGLLTVVSHNSRESGYDCLCDCGGKTIARGHALKTGRHRSCGCQRKTKDDHVAAKNEILKRYRAAARARGYSFELPASEFFALIAQPCRYCGLPPSAKTHLKRHEDFRYSGVDRVDNQLGYTAGNCVPCCDICNNSKSTLTVDEWKSWIKRVYNHQAGTQ